MKTLTLLAFIQLMTLSNCFCLIEVSFVGATKFNSQASIFLLHEFLRFSLLMYCNFLKLQNPSVIKMIAKQLNIAFMLSVLMLWLKFCKQYTLFIPPFYMKALQIKLMHSFSIYKTESVFLTVSLNYSEIQTKIFEQNVTGQDFFKHISFELNISFQLQR